MITRRNLIASGGIIACTSLLRRSGIPQALPGGASNLQSNNTRTSFKPGEEWLDTAGKPIQAHGGSTFRLDEKYYWYGENKEFTTGRQVVSFRICLIVARPPYASSIEKYGARFQGVRMQPQIPNLRSRSVACLKPLRRLLPSAVLLMGMVTTAEALRAQMPNDPPKSVAVGLTDPKFKEPYVDRDEWRDKPVRHRYVHGGFKGTTALFAFYYPPNGQYQGRFFQYVTPTPASENIDAQGEGSFGAEEHMRFSLTSGAYFVQTNEGGLSAIVGDQTIVGYRINAAAAEYSRVLAEKMYGPARPYGYAFGGSGGCFKTLSGFENTSTWDGAVPFVCGSPMAIPNVYTVRMLAMRILKDKFASIADAVEPGGNGDMYQGLNEEQSAVLREVTKMGFPSAGWFEYKTLGEGAYPVLFPIVRMLDRGYFKDFWTVPGYEGVNASPSLAQVRVQYATTVVKAVSADDPAVKGLFGGVDAAKQTVMASPFGFEVESIPPGSLEGAFLLVKSGDSSGKELPIGKVIGKTVFISVNPFGADNSKDVQAIKPGDQVVLDNSDFLAAQYYHRHQVPGPDFYVWNQFRGPDGKPLEPQRRMLIGPMVTGAGSVQSGRFKGKMIVVESMMDQDAFPWQADWYRTKVKEALGEHLDDNFRLWFTEHAVHGDDATNTTHTVSYVSSLQQALRDVSAWVEKGIPPPASTHYKVNDGQVEVPPTAVGRKGIQPVIILKANGGTRADVTAGNTVRFSAVIEVPPKSGKVVSAEWDFDGSGKFADSAKVTPGVRMTLTATHAFTEPGTYFVTLRAASQRDGDAKAPFTKILNLDRVRVVVTQ